MPQRSGGPTLDFFEDIDEMQLLASLSDPTFVDPSISMDFDDNGDTFDIPKDVFRCTDEAKQYGEALDQIAASRLGLSVVGALDVCYESDRVPSGQDLMNNSQMVTVNDLETILHYQSFMKENRTRKPPIESEEEDRIHSIIRRPVIEAFIDIMTLDSIENRFPKRTTGFMVADIVTNIIKKMNLIPNPEQLRAYNLVADHLLSGSGDQLLMHVSGVGGTGKSHVINSIVELFTNLGIRNQLALGAPTGIAAVLIGGQTLHSLAQLTPGRKAKSMERLTSAWKDVRYLIIDEVSMIGARFLSQFSNRLREARYHYPESCSKPFGGMNVIFMGDFGQLKPPAQTCLYAHSVIKNPTFRTSSSVQGIDAMNGVLLWREVTQVITLIKNQRQAGDLTYAAFLSRIRVGSCSGFRHTLTGSSVRDDLNYLLDRVIDKLDPDTLVLFKDAPIIVGNKVTRDILNAKRIKSHAADLCQKVELYYSADTIKRASAPTGIRKMLWDIPSSDNNESFGRLPLFAGMKVMVTENIAFPFGIVNGSEGVIRSIQYNENSSGNKTAVVAYVHIPGCKVHLPGLGLDVVPIFPVSTRIEYDIQLRPGHAVTGFTRKQLPLVPGYVYTDFNSQGRTLERAIVDLYTARGQGIYMMLSRVKSLSGLAILRWFPPNKVFGRLPEELREELERIRMLSDVNNS
ncbi:hypothetical protein D9619_005958 [Psilocybe cf. subviscida]|uniref:ATP-dependent DNA helicase n=1 Tax=Psilocybe cf. subviscida TaxID=2480587 RepID=A0A8H5FC77_9AGAR|nr:hypothetical protein D9619_005958 [Psilocybe cf. subviscida]